MNTSGGCWCFLRFLSIDLGSTSGIPNRAARALCFSSSESSTVVPSAGVVVEVTVDVGCGAGAGS